MIISLLELNNNNLVLLGHFKMVIGTLTRVEKRVELRFVVWVD